MVLTNPSDIIEINLYIKESFIRTFLEKSPDTNDYNVTTIVKDYLQKNDEITGVKEHIKCCVDLLNYLVLNKWFIDKHKKFKKTVRDKIIEFSIKHHLYLARHYNILFDECLFDTCSIKNPNISKLMGSFY